LLVIPFTLFVIHLLHTYLYCVSYEKHQNGTHWDTFSIITLFLKKASAKMTSHSDHDRTIPNYKTR